jgi:hypothetical protein
LAFSSDAASSYSSSGCRFSGNAVRTATFRLDATLDSHFTNSFWDARNWWNSANTDVRYDEASPTAGYNFLVKQTNIGGDSFPTQFDRGGCPGGFNGPGSKLIVDSVFSGVDGLNGIDIAHELGHAGGIGHVTYENWCGDTTGPAPTYAFPKSVMNAVSGQRWAYYNCGSVLPPYSDDLAGIRAVYPGGGK